MIQPYLVLFTLETEFSSEQFIIPKLIFLTLHHFQVQIEKNMCITHWNWYYWCMVFSLLNFCCHFVVSTKRYLVVFSSGGEATYDTSTEVLSDRAVIQCQLWANCWTNGSWRLSLVLKLLLTVAITLCDSTDMKLCIMNNNVAQHFIHIFCSLA